MTIGSDQAIDAALIVLTASDYRMTIQQTVAIKIIAKFFKDFEPRKVFMVITHVDQNPPDEDFIQGKIASFIKYGNIEISRDHVILFDNTKESLAPLVEKINRGTKKMRFLEPEELVRKADEIFRELPGDFSKQDKEQGTNNSQMFAMMMEMMKEQTKMIS